MLQANGIAPLTPAKTVDNTRKRPGPASTTSNEVLDLTLDEDDDPPPKRVKTEPAVEIKHEEDNLWPSGSGTEKLGDFIDLTT